jgi:tetratricopeptide (TPR) repeat protein
LANQEFDQAATISQTSVSTGSRAFLCVLWLKKTGAWLLAAGYLAATVFCLQIMSSAFIRALGDRASEKDDPGLSADRLYALAVKIDPQNWRAYKGMGSRMFANRYYSLEMDEKISWGGQERSWYEKAYLHNPKDPEICLAYGKVLIFLGKNQGVRHLALGTGVGEGMSAVRSDGGTASSLSTDIGDDDPPDSDLKSIGQRPLAISEKQAEDSMQQAADSFHIPEDGGKPAADSRQYSADRDALKPKTINLTPAQQIERGIDLLREACRYRPFNDGYWWSLGVELRKAGRYEEALEVFRRAASINRTPSTILNIEWLNARLKALADGDEAADDLPLQEESSKTTASESKLDGTAEPALNLDGSGAAADPELMDLLNRMGE